jgi:ABC-type Fe3+/spermidine/putrescine transport system ATPase subunit
MEAFNPIKNPQPISFCVFLRACYLERDVDSVHHLVLTRFAGMSWKLHGLSELKLSLVHLRKVFVDPQSKAEFVAVQDFSLEIEGAEFVSLLGPSGCGKTSVLRMIAGLEVPSSGEIFSDGVNITKLPAHRRNFVMVFQNPSLFSHLNVEANIEYGLKIRKIQKPERKIRLQEMLELVRLQGLEKRFPNELSGGQRQRVALARALIVRPKVLLLDEPLANLDQELRKELSHEIRDLQKNFSIPTLYVTHDELEAKEISDRVIRISDQTRPISSLSAL